MISHLSASGGGQSITMPAPREGGDHQAEVLEQRLACPEARRLACQVEAARDRSSARLRPSGYDVAVSAAARRRLVGAKRLAYRLVLSTIIRQYLHIIGYSGSLYLSPSESICTRIV